MTNPPPPPASAMGLVAEWRETDRLLMAKGDPFNIGCSWTFGECAKDLAAALSLSEEEREAIRKCDAVVAANQYRTQIIMPAAEYDTIRQLLARTFPDAGGDEGEK